MHSIKCVVKPVICTEAQLFPDVQTNLTLYSTIAFIILDSDGQRVAAKYYRPKNAGSNEPKGLATLKEQRAFEKGLWDKTKKAGGELVFLFIAVLLCSNMLSPHSVVLYRCQL